MKPIARMIVTLTMRGIRAWGINHAAGRYSYQCSIIGWVEFLSRWWWPQDTTKRDWCCQSCVVLPKKWWFYYIEKRFVPPPELVSGQSSDSSSAWVPRRIGAVWRLFLIVVIDFKFRAHKITTYTEKRQIIIGKNWGRRNFFLQNLQDDYRKVNRWSSESRDTSSLDDFAESRQVSTEGQKWTDGAARANPCLHELCRVATEVDRRSKVKSEKWKYYEK